MGNSTVKRNVSNTTGYTQNRSSCPIPPKMGTFTGKDDWRPYFCHIVRKYECSEQKKLDKLMECLRDHALQFFTTRPRYVQEIYQHAWKKLEIRFGRTYLPNVVSYKGCASFQKCHLRSMQNAHKTLQLLFRHFWLFHSDLGHRRISDRMSGQEGSIDSHGHGSGESR